MARKKWKPAYEVGNKKPPKETQFKPGQSGNPKGRPKKSKLSTVDLLEAELRKTISVSENGKKTSMTKIQAIIKRVVNSALTGNAKDVALVLKYLPHLDAKIETAALQPPNVTLLFADVDDEIWKTQPGYTGPLNTTETPKAK